MELKDYLAELSQVELLTRERETELWQQYKEQGSLKARQLLIESYQPLVFKTAMPFHELDNVMDVIQEGTVGLIEAVENYEYQRGVAFSLYAMHRIRGRMLNFVQQESRADIACMDSVAEDGGASMKECLADDGATVDELAEGRELANRLHLALDRLPAKEREVLEGVYLQNRAVKSMAEDLHVTSSHIYRLQKTGIRRVRGMLSRFMHNW